MEEYNLSSIQEYFGSEFLQYVLNFNEPLNRFDSQSNLSLNDQQVYVLQNLSQLVQECAKKAAVSPMYDITYFLKGEGMKSNSIYNEFRSLCKGHITIPKSADQIENYLLEYAVNTYPSLLISPTIINPFIIELGTYDMLDESRNLISLLKADNDFSRFVNEGLVTYFGYLLNKSFIINSSHFTMAYDFVYRCFLNCSYRMNYSLGQLIAEIRTNISKLRLIASGQEIVYSSFRGLYGLRLRDTTYLDLSPKVRLWALNSSDGPLSSLRKTAANFNGNELGGAILEIHHAGKGNNLPQHNFETTFTDSTLNSVVRHLELAVIFASNLVYAPFSETFWDVDLPLYKSLNGRTDYKSFGSGVISSENQQEVKAWFNFLDKSDLTLLKVPIKRIQNAICKRSDPEDSLLDAFIAWEGMFSGKTETTFQVTAAIAKFLEDDPLNRKNLMKRLEELYSLRSNITHGDSQEHPLLKKQNINDLRDEVLTIALRCLKKILQDEELLRMKPKERVKHQLVWR